MMISNDDNLGNNIRSLRKAYGEKQVELAEGVHVSSSLVSEWESGKKAPKRDSLESIAFRYSVTVEQLVNGDCSGIDFSNIDFTKENFISASEEILPLIISDKALEDSYFKKGYDYTQLIMTAARNGNTDGITDSIVERIVEAYTVSFEELKTIESAANMIWWVFILSALIFDEHMAEMSEAVVYRKASGKDFVKKYMVKNKRTNDVENESCKKSFILEIQEDMVKYLRVLKKSPKYSNLADYYSALRYIAGIVITDYGQEWNKNIGIEMMKSLKMLGNPYALKFFRGARKMYK